jgi:hypothetical protein
MPVYLCQPGTGASEPWKHGIEVYTAPFAMAEASAHSSERDVADASAADSSFPEDNIANWANNNNNNNERNNQSTPDGGEESQKVPIRRLRHAEIVLVDDVSIAYDRYWLRLRWPGSKGGFAGYIAIGKVSEPTWIRNNAPDAQGMYDASFYLVSVDRKCILTHSMQNHVIQKEMQ